VLNKNPDAILPHQDFLRLPIGEREDWRRKHLLEKRVTFPCSASTARPIPSSPKPPNIIEYLLAVSGKNEKLQKSHCP